jgi:hypothetical protein
VLIAGGARRRMVAVATNAAGIKGASAKGTHADAHLRPFPWLRGA